jgi:FkbH-like protein
MPWLTPAPAGFRTLVRALDPNDEAGLRRLSAHELDINQAGLLTRFLRGNMEAVAKTGGFSPVKLGVVASHTTDYMMDALPSAGLRHGLLLDCVGVDFGMVAQSVLDPNGALAQAKPQYVLLSLDQHYLGLAEPALGDGEADARVEAAIRNVLSLAEGVRNVIGAGCVLQTVPPPPAPLFGSYDAQIAGAPRAMAAAYNERLRKEVVRPGDVLVDVGYLASTLGLAKWHDARAWHSAKLPFAVDLTPAYADLVGQALGAARGKARKCLVLDLDNTLWAGVIGDDGLAGIGLGQGSAAGEAHLSVQRFALALRQRGIVLAVCSKNDDANARLPFREHPEMLLKEEHIAAFVANWTDKASNLRDIAKALNIGTDALVFLDDNPAEREIVRATLPEVAVPEIEDDPSLYVERLARAGYFDANSFSDEDRVRADLYRANSQRLEAGASVTDIAEYLRSLEMTIDLRPFDEVGRARISQLANKSNQFNLTTRRYTEAEIAAAEADPNKFTLQVRLVDKFGDNGMISVIIFDKGDEVWACETWLMSCRVLGRRVEEAVLAHVAKAAIAAGAKRLTGVYLPTKKNSLVKDHFGKLGFTRLSEDDDGRSEWTLELEGWTAPDLPMHVVGQD